MNTQNKNNSNNNNCMQKKNAVPGCLFVDDSNFAQNQVSDFKNKIYLTECSHLCVCMSQKLRLFIFSKKNEFSLMRHPSCKHCHRMKKKNRKKTDDCTEHRTHTHTEPSEGTHKKTLFFKLYALGDLNRPASQKERTRGSRHETHTIKYSLRAQTHTHARNRIQNKNNSNNKKNSTNNDDDNGSGGGGGDVAFFSLHFFADVVVFLLIFHSLFHSESFSVVRTSYLSRSVRLVV